MSRRIRLHIDKVVINGPAPADRAAFERALASSLGDALRKAATGPGLQGLASSQRVDGGRLAKPTDPAALGARIVGRLTGGES